MAISSTQYTWRRPVEWLHVCPTVGVTGPTIRDRKFGLVLRDLQVTGVAVDEHSNRGLGGGYSSNQGKRVDVIGKLLGVS